MILNKIHITDSRYLLGKLNNLGSVVDLVVTSPPYWDMKNYDDIPNQIGFGQTKKEYLEDLRLVIKGCFEVTKSTGSFWLVVDSYRRNGKLELLPLVLANIAIEVGWKLKDHIIWDKQYSLPWHQKGQMRNVTESILFFTKSNEYKYYVDRIKHLDEISKWWVDFPERFNPKGKTPSNIWRFPMRRRGTWPDPAVVDHLCPFPTGLVARIIELTTDEGDVVLDPFAGSGVVLAQAEVMNRKFIGFEINPSYVDMYEDVVRDEVKKDWEELKAWRKTLSRAGDNFEQTIMKLRALKYSRQATKAFSNALPDDEKVKIKAFVCLASIPEEHIRGKPFDVEIWIIGDKNYRIFKEGLEKARERMGNPPLTQYEIKAQINSSSYSKFISKTGIDPTKDIFYLYPGQRPRKFIASDTIEVWFKNDRLKHTNNGGIIVPPLLANIAEDVAWVLEK